jgi:hypothetical protein
VSHPAENDYVEGVVCAAVTIAVEPVTMNSAAAGEDWCGSAQVRERGFGFEAVGVVADADEYLFGDLRTDTG